MKVALLLLLLIPAAVMAQQGDIRIRGGLVHDGSGAPGRIADVVLRGDRVVFVGDAVGRFGPIVSEILGTRARLAPADLRLPSAVTVAELGAAALERGEAVDPASLVPLYVRPSEAELARERRQGAGHPN